MGSALQRRLVVTLALTLATALVWLLGWDESAASWTRPWRDQELGLWWGQAAYWTGLGGVQAAAVGLAALWGRFSRRGELWRTGLVALGGLAVSGLLVQVVKVLVGRPRPRMALPVWQLFGPTLKSDLHSFPSGHAATSFALAAVLGERWPGQAWVFHLVAAMVCAGRVISGSHHMSDVMGGALLGLAVGWPLARRFAVRERGLR